MSIEVVAAAMALDGQRDGSPSSPPAHKLHTTEPLDDLFAALLTQHLPPKARRLTGPEKWSTLETDDQELIEKRRKEIASDVVAFFNEKRDELQNLLESLVAGQEASEEEEDESLAKDINNPTAVTALEKSRRNSLTKPLKSSLKAGDAAKKKVQFEDSDENNDNESPETEDTETDSDRPDGKEPKTDFQDPIFPRLPEGAPTHPPEKPASEKYVRPTADSGVPTIREDVLAALYSPDKATPPLGPQLDLPPSSYKDKRSAALKPKLYGDTSGGDEDLFNFDEELPEDADEEEPAKDLHKSSSVTDPSDLPDKLKKEYLSYFGPIDEDSDNVTTHARLSSTAPGKPMAAPSGPMVVGSLGRRADSKYKPDTSTGTGAFDMWVHEEDNGDDRSFLGKNSFNPRIGEIPEESSFSVGSPNAKSATMKIGSVPYIQNPLSNSYKPNRGMTSDSPFAKPGSVKQQTSRFPSGTSFSGVGLTERQQQRIESEPAAHSHSRVSQEERDDIDVSHSLEEEIKINEIRELAPGMMSFSQRMMYEKDGRDTQKISSSPYM